MDLVFVSLFVVGYGRGEARTAPQQRENKTKNQIQIQFKERIKKIVK